MPRPNPLESNYKNWKEWLDGNLADGRIDNNSISGVVYSLVQEMAVHEAYLAICKARPKSHLATSLFLRSSSFAYFEVQAMRIRRLTDKNPTSSSPRRNLDIYSLRRVVDDLQALKTEGLLTRRNMCLQLEYPTTAARAEAGHRKELARAGTGSFATHFYDAGNFHKTLDNICTARGSVSREFMNELKSRVYEEKNDKLSDVREFVNKYIAHSASDESRRQLLREIRLSTDEVKSVIAGLVECFYVLEMLLMRASHSVLIPHGWEVHLNNLDDEEKEIIKAKFDKINKQCESWRTVAYKLING